MKRCPTCQREYADDSLRFCLQDGATLLSVSDESASSDPYATLTLPAAVSGRSEPPPTEVLGAHTSETIQSPKPIPTASQQPRATMRDAQGFAAPQKSQNSALVAVLTVVVVILLLALVGIGAWVLLRDKKGGEEVERRGNNNQGNTTTTNSNGSIVSSTPVAPTPAPTLAPTPAPPPVDTAAIRQQVTDTLNRWSAASMAHDIEAHMSYYADTLDTYYSRSGVSADVVRADRERAYAVYSTIDIELSNIKVTADASGERATAIFDKTWNFEGSKYSSGSVQQKIWLVKTGGRWRITGEKDLQVYYVNK
jgi:ketosteroid isomerase-like protein